MSAGLGIWMILNTKDTKCTKPASCPASSSAPCPSCQNFTHARQAADAPADRMRRPSEPYGPAAPVADISASGPSGSSAMNHSANMMVEEMPNQIEYGSINATSEPMPACGT